MISQLRLDNIVVAQQTADSQVVGWTLLGIGPAANGAVVEIRRSYAENDGFELIATIAATTGFYRDESVNLFDRWRFPYYKLTVVDSLGNRREYPAARVSGSLDGIAISIIRNTNIQLRQGGNPVLIYSRKSDESDRCSACWDSVLRKVTVSFCEVCFNTGYSGGYYTPVLTLATIYPEVKSIAAGDVTRQPSTTSGLFGNYPVLRPRDLIYEVDTGKRYRVVTITPTEKQRMLLNQTATLEGLAAGDVENRLAVPQISELTPVLSRSTAPSRYITVDNFSPQDTSIGYLYI